MLYNSRHYTSPIARHAEVSLYDDKIKKHVLIYRDFDIAPIGAINTKADAGFNDYLEDDDELN